MRRLYLWVHEGLVLELICDLLRLGLQQRIINNWLGFHSKSK